MAIGGERRHEELQLPLLTDHLGVEAVDQCTVDLHVQRSVGQRVKGSGTGDQ